LSTEIIAREIGGELIVVPITSGVGDLEDDLYCLNATAKAIWEKIMENWSVHSIIAYLTDLYSADMQEIETDVKSILHELSVRKIIVRES
jgi:hypothetical protein